MSLTEVRDRADLEKLQETNKMKFENLLSTNYGKNYFSRTLFQEKFNENKLHMLTDVGFQDLFFLVSTYLRLSCEDEESFESLRLIIKSSLCFCKQLKNNEYFFLLNLLMDKQVLKQNILQMESFWVEWFYSEINSKIEISKQEDHYFSLLVEISSTMTALKLEFQFIKKCLIELIAMKVIKDNLLIKDLEVALEKQYKNIHNINFIK